MEQIFQKKAFNIPNALTVSRIMLIPAAVCFYSRNQETAALCVYLLAMLTDVLDGMVARKTQQITTLGKLLDPLADKLWLLTMTALFFFESVIPGWVLALLIMKEMFLILGSTAAIARGIVVQALPIGKTVTLIFTASITARLADLPFAADAAMYIALVLSMAAMIWYTWMLVVRLGDEKVIRYRATQ